MSNLRIVMNPQHDPAPTAKAIAQYQEVERMGRRRTHAAEWTATQRVPLAAVPTPMPTRWDRFADAGWRLHDGMPMVWAGLFAVVLMASAAATVTIVAMAMGWLP
jgi:hypothetical protein